MHRADPLSRHLIGGADHGTGYQRHVEAHADGAHQRAAQAGQPGAVYRGRALPSKGQLTSG